MLPMKFKGIFYCVSLIYNTIFILNLFYLYNLYYQPRVGLGLGSLRSQHPRPLQGRILDEQLVILEVVPRWRPQDRVQPIGLMPWPWRDQDQDQDHDMV